ncbi:hypothetical protein [Aureispira anguillae]|uniref:Uncharacterized protein n=1 Tax=Aureispira anguillae TaxID=2864201 RepID=A0A915YBZ4_9BACT|nr:hypothetical protein [Aureispira anguillae]BDS10261.1 hypothetical protein AsAng_0009690 [Aureispira anguillae]
MSNNNSIFSFNQINSPLGNWLDEVKFKVTALKGDFVPLGIQNIKNKTEQATIQFLIEIEEQALNRIRIEILHNGQLYYQGEIVDTNRLQVGQHIWEWDGFDQNEILDTAILRSNALSFRFIGYKGGSSKTLQPSLNIQRKKKQIQWMDFKIDRLQARINLDLRVNLEDGGTQGLNKASNVDSSSISVNGGIAPFSTASRSYTALINLALRGLQYHYGRNNNHPSGKNVRINNQPYELMVSASNTTVNSMEGIKLIYRTNKKPGRASNPGTITDPISLLGNIITNEKIFYTVGYIGPYSGGPLIGKYWNYIRPVDADTDFRHTIAHEIGHEVLKSFGGTPYSYKHKGTSNIFQGDKKNQPTLPNNGEVDLMKYYAINPPRGQSEYSMYIASCPRAIIAEDDALGLLWCSKMTYKS